MVREAAVDRVATPDIRISNSDEDAAENASMLHRQRSNDGQGIAIADHALPTRDSMLPSSTGSSVSHEDEKQSSERDVSSRGESSHVSDRVFSSHSEEMILSDNEKTATSRHTRASTPTTMRLGFPNSPSSTADLRSRAATPMADDQRDSYITLAPPSAASIGLGARHSSGRLSSLFDGQSGFLSSTTTLRSQNPSRLSLANFLPKSTTPEPKIIPAPETIIQFHHRDDFETAKGWKRFAANVAPITTFLSTAAYIVYLTFRIYCVVDSQRTYHKIYAPAWVFIAVELATAIPSMVNNGWTMMALKKRRRPKLRLTGDLVPTVDVLITCCGEDDDLVMDTVRAACDLDYPNDRFRVVLLDDGKSAELEKGCEQMNRLFGNVFYVARPKFKGVPHHFKSGNLNYGLEAVKEFPGGASEYVAALDADMIPEKIWLRAILPHMLLDTKMALACPPQLFYNTPQSDPLAQNLDFFVHVIEPIKDSLGVAWCTGSGYIVRRTAIDDVGQFPLGSLAEDVATSTLMLGKGWHTAYIHEPLQFGTVPEDYGAHLKQRTRWAIGTVDTSFKLRFCLWGEKTRFMTPAQRFSGFLYSFLSLYSILYSVALFAIPVILIMGHTLIAYTSMNQLRWLVRLCFIQTMVTRISELFLFMPAGYNNGQRGNRYQLWMSPYISLCLIRSFVLPTWLGGQTMAFKPTGSIGSSLNERDAKKRRNVFVRLWTILFNYLAIYHFAFVYFTLVGVSFSSYRCISENRGTHDDLLCLVTHAFWPPTIFLFLCVSLWTPIAYAISPPSVPDREELLTRDPNTGVAHPTHASKKVAFGPQAAWFEIEYTLSTLYTCLIFAASFVF